MSAILQIATEMNDREALLQGLEDYYGFPVKYHDTPQEMKTWGGRRNAMANVVLPAAKISKRYDAGFLRQKDGSFNFVSTDDDQHDLTRIKQHYHMARGKEIARQKGMRLASVEREKTVSGVQFHMYFEPLSGSAQGVL